MVRAPRYGLPAHIGFRKKQCALPLTASRDIHRNAILPDEPSGSLTNLKASEAATAESRSYTPIYLGAVFMLAVCFGQCLGIA
jgi:hypothetical protein